MNLHMFTGPCSSSTLEDRQVISIVNFLYTILIMDLIIWNVMKHREEVLKFHNFNGSKFLGIWLIFIIDLGNCRYGVDLAKQLAASLLSVLASCGSVRISFSQRTPQKVWSILKFLKILLLSYTISSRSLFSPSVWSFKQVSSIIEKELGNNPKVYIWDGQGKYIFSFFFPFKN